MNNIAINFGLPKPDQNEQYVEVWYHSTQPYAPSTVIGPKISFFGNGQLANTAYQNFVTNPTSVQVNTTILYVAIDHGLQFTAVASSASTSQQYQRSFEKFSYFYWKTQRKTYGGIPIFYLIPQNIYNLGVSAGAVNAKPFYFSLLNDPMTLIPGGNTDIYIDVGPTTYTAAASTVGTDQYLPGIQPTAFTNSLGFEITSILKGVELQPTT